MIIINESRAHIQLFYFLSQILVSKLILYPFLMSWTPRQNLFLEVNMWAVCDI